MSKDFDNDFYHELQNSVVPDEPTPAKGGPTGKIDELISRKEQLLRTLEEMESNVIVDPKAVKKIKKEIKDIEKAIEAGKLESQTEAPIETDEEPKEQQEEKEGERLEEEEQDVAREEEERRIQEQERSEILKEKYYMALVSLYEQRIANIELAKKEGNLVTSRESFEREIVMEEEMYRLRDEYMAMGYEDPFENKRTELIAKERDAKESIEMTLREKARKFRLLQEELSQIDQKEKEINEELLDPNISSVHMEELNKRLEELGEKRKEVELQLADIRKDLEPAVEERTKRAFERAGLEIQHFETLTKSDKANYVYQQSKVQTMNANTEKAINQEYRNLKLRIEEREHHIKELGRELERTPSTDFERRLELLSKLDKETAMLEADRESKSQMDRGIQPTETERKQDVIERFEKEEDRKDEFEKETESVRTVIEEQNEKIGERVVRDPVKATVEDKHRNVEAKAATIAMVMDNPTKPGPESTLDNLKQYAVAACVIEGLDKLVRDPDNPEDAAAIVENDKQIAEAQKELQKKQEELENKVV